MKAVLIYGEKNIPFSDLPEFISALKWDKLENWEKEIFEFIRSWLSDKEYFEIETSGSTGKPKQIMVHRDDLILSATYTIDFLGLKPGSTALLCLPARYIAGKMMIVRAFTGNLNLCLTKPSNNPLSGNTIPMDFLAITPYQLNHIFADTSSLKFLRTISKILIGGSDLITPGDVFDFKPKQAFLTYGMTESLSHIALCDLSVPGERQFKLINSKFSISQDEKNCLVIQSPYKHEKTIKTRDLVELTGQDSFKFIGRIDHVVNSGGIKIHPEIVENELKEIIDEPYFIGSLPDEKLGEKLVLVVETSNSIYYQSYSFKEKMKDVLKNKYHIPHSVFVIKSFDYNPGNKINRRTTLEKLK